MTRIAVFGPITPPQEEGVEIVNYDIRGEHLDFDKDGSFDKIIVGLVLPVLPRDKVMDFLLYARTVLNERGEIELHVPSAEWAAKQIFTNKPDSMTYYMLYGQEELPFRACYSMLALRTLLERAKFIIRQANESIVRIAVSDTETANMPVNSILAVRYE